MQEDPQVGSWYRNDLNDRIFEVVFFDEDEGHIEVQYRNGEVEEVDLDTWYDLEVSPVDILHEWDEGPDVDPDEDPEDDEDEWSESIREEG